MAGEYLIDGGSHIDAALSNLAIKGFSGAATNIADQVLPIVPVSKQSDIYYKLDKDNWLKIYNTLRAPLAPAPLADWQVSSEKYYADNYALGTMHAKETLANADMAIRTRENSNAFVVEALARDRENRVATLLTTSGNLGYTYGLVSSHATAGAVSFTNVNSSDPVAAVTSGQAYIQAHTGLVANTLVFDWDTYQLVKLNARIRNSLQYTDPRLVPDGLLANLFKVDRILVGQGIKNVAREGATASLTNIWTSGAILAHIEPARSVQTTTLGLQFRWRPEGFPADMVVQRYDHHERSRMAEIINAQYFSDEKLVAPDLGVLFLNG